jgi:ornithine carbamoyltransferase
MDTASRDSQGIFSLADLSSADMQRMVDRSCALYSDINAHDLPLQGLLAGLLFTKTSTRTRTAFTAGVIKLGGTPIGYGPDDLQTNTGESLADTGRVLGSMLDVLIARTSGPAEEMRMISRYGGIPVINAMAAEEHPTQGICDLAMIKVMRGTVDGVRLLYIGEGNNTAVALAHGLSHYSSCAAIFLTPHGYGLPPDTLSVASRRGAAAGSTFTELHSMSELPGKADVVYTTRWQTTGTSKADPYWRQAFRPFFVTAELMERWPGSWFMHDLPANRGEEVSSEVLDGPRSLAWSQVRMKLTSAMAVLEWTLDPQVGSMR